MIVCLSRFAYPFFFFFFLAGLWGGKAWCILHPFKILHNINIPIKRNGWLVNYNDLNIIETGYYAVFGPRWSRKLRRMHEVVILLFISFFSLRVISTRIGEKKLLLPKTHLIFSLKSYISSWFQILSTTDL